jgi:hypothetical protein
MSSYQQQHQTSEAFEAENWSNVSTKQIIEEIIEIKKAIERMGDLRLSAIDR